jgi:type IV secretory pathway VirB2 component (pilin)
MYKFFKTSCINFARKNIDKISQLIILFFFTTAVNASTMDSYPWTVTLQKVMTSISGPVAYVCAGLAICMSGFVMMFVELQGGGKKFIQAALGISIVFGAATIISSLFSFTGAIIN